jgi:putative oxidoreductase
MIQFVCGTLVAIGAVTRIAAVLASGSMAYAYFIVHQPNGLVPILNGGEAATQFCWGFLLVAALGAGPFSIDALISKARRGASAEATPGRAKERVTA